MSPAPPPGSPGPPDDADGFLSPSTPMILRRRPPDSAAPFMQTPGDALLHLALRLCVAGLLPAVATLATLLAGVGWISQLQLLLPQPVGTIERLVNFWLGSAFQSPIIRSFGSRIFSISVANLQLAKFIVSLQGVCHGAFVLGFHEGPPKLGVQISNASCDDAVSPIGYAVSPQASHAADGCAGCVPAPPVDAAVPHVGPRLCLVPSCPRRPDRAVRFRLSRARTPWLLSFSPCLLLMFPRLSVPWLRLDLRPMSPCPTLQPPWRPLALLLS